MYFPLSRAKIFNMKMHFELCSPANEVPCDSPAPSDMMFLTPGHAARLPARQAAAHWHPAAQAAYEVSWPQN